MSSGREAKTLIDEINQQFPTAQRSNGVKSALDGVGTALDGVETALSGVETPPHETYSALLDLIVVKEVHRDSMTRLGSEKLSFFVEFRSRAPLGDVGKVSC